MLLARSDKHTRTLSSFCTKHMPKFSFILPVDSPFFAKKL